MGPRNLGRPVAPWRWQRGRDRCKPAQTPPSTCRMSSTALGTATGEAGSLPGEPSVPSVPASGQSSKASFRLFQDQNSYVASRGLTLPRQRDSSSPAHPVRGGGFLAPCTGDPIPAALLPQTLTFPPPAPCSPSLCLPIQSPLSSGASSRARGCKSPSTSGWSHHRLDVRERQEAAFPSLS